MPSITLAVSDAEHPVPGFAPEALAGMFCMHDPAVRRWIEDHRPPEPGVVVIADPAWVNQGDGTDSLTFPVCDRDAEAVAAMWEHIMSLPVPADENPGR